MKIKVLRSFGGYKAGQEFDWGDGIARLYIGRGLVAPVEERVEAAVVEQRSERAMIDTRPRKRQPK
jgi:hypothetical protein